MATTEELLAQGYKIATPAPAAGAVPSLRTEDLLAQGYKIAGQDSTPSIFSDPIGALTSSDWWLTRPSGERVSAGQAVAGPALAALDSMSLGHGDEFAAGGNALVDALLGGKFLSQAYNDRIAQSRAVQQSFSKASPTADIGLRLVSALKLPVGSTVKAEDSLLKGTAKIAGESGALGSLFGFGEGEGGIGERFQSAAEGLRTGLKYGAIVGGPTMGLLKGATAIAEKAPEWANKFLNRAAGAKPSDFVKSARQNEGALAATEQTALNLSLKQARKEGVFEGTSDFADAYRNIQNKQGSLGEQIDGFIAIADRRRLGKPVEPRFDHAEDFIQKSVPSDDVENLIGNLEQYKEALKAQGDGSLAYLQRQKVILGEKVYPEGQLARSGLDKAIRRDLKETIERETDRLLPSDKARIIRNLNRRWGALDEVRPIVRREMGKAEGASVEQTARDFWRTSGGYGVPILGGTMASLYTHDPTWLALGLAGPLSARYLNSPAGAVRTANILEKAAGLVNFAERSAEAVPRMTASTTSRGEFPQVRSAYRDQFPLDVSARRSGVQTPRDSVPKSDRKDLSGENLSANPNRRSQGTTQEGTRYPSPNSTVTPNPTQARTYTRSEIKALVAREHPLVQAVVKVESAFNPRAVSKKNAKGLGQLMDATAAAHGVKDPFDPVQNLRGVNGALSEELERYTEDPRLAIAAYNLGSPKLERAIKRAGGVRSWPAVRQFVPLETREYVTKVLTAYRSLV